MPKLVLKNSLAALASVFTLFAVILCLADAITVPSPIRSLMRWDNGQIDVITVARGDVLELAGVKERDRVVAFDGQGFSFRFDFPGQYRRHPPGDRVVFTVLRNGEKLDLPVVLPRNLTPWRATRLAIPLFAIFSLGVGVYFWRPEVSGGLLFLFSCLGPCLYVAGTATGLVANNWFGKLYIFSFGVLSSLSWALILHFSLVFPEPRKLHRRLKMGLPLFYAIALLVGLQYFVPVFGPEWERHTVGPDQMRSILFLFVVSEALAFLLAAGCMTLVSFRGSTLRVRGQARLVAIGLVLELILWLGLYEIPLLTRQEPLIDQFTLASLTLITPLFIAAAIVRYRMFDIDLLARQRLIYGGASGLVLGLFVLLLGGAGWLIGSIAGAGDPGLIGLAGAVAGAGAAALQPLRVMGHQIVDRVLYRKSYDYRAALTEIAGRLSGFLDAGELAQYLEVRIDELLGPTWQMTILRTGDGHSYVIRSGAAAPTEFCSGDAAQVWTERLRLRQHPFRPDRGQWIGGPLPELVAPMVLGESVVGMLALGPRRADVPYRTEDHDFLATLASLAGAVFERTRLLDERAFRERLALVGSATASLIHEIKNPLAGIQSTATVLRRRLAADPRSQELSDIILREVDRLGGSVLNVLSWIRPQRPQPAPVDLAALLSQLVQLVGPDFAPAAVAVEVKLDESLPMVWGDPARLQQLFLNLLLNAKEAMPRGGTVLVEAGGAFDGKGRVAGAEVRFADQGAGFSSEVLARAFEPFFTTKRLGTGLGLANVKKIAEEHGGTITLGNRPEGGGLVSVRLPESR